MNLHDINVGVHRNKKPFRKGRGPGSGSGKTAGRGHKGQKSRSGTPQHVMFQGGQMPLYRRIPKRGFNNQFAVPTAAINLGVLDRVFDKNSEVTPAALRDKKMIPYRCQRVRILGVGSLSKPLKISAHHFSESARQKIQEAGGEAVAIDENPPAKIQRGK